MQTWDSASRLATPADLLNVGRKAADTFEWKIFMADNDVCRNSILRTSTVDVRNRVANPPICVQAETSFYLSTLCAGASPMI